jgi:hypothetical protein
MLSRQVGVDPIGTGLSGIRTRYESLLTVLVALTVVLLAITSMNLGGLLFAHVVAQQSQVAVCLALA